MSTAVATTHKDIDLSARSFWAKPPEERDEAFALLRRENPVPWSRPAESDLLPPELNIRGFWSLTKQEDIRMASRHPEIFSSAQGITMEDFAPEGVEVAQSFIAMDAPRHTQLRGITTDAFKPKNVRRFESWIRGHAHDLVSEMAHLGEGDFVELVSVKLPGRIFGSFFGLPEGDVRDKAVTAASGWWAGPTRISAAAERTGAVHGRRDGPARVASVLIPERRANPGDDLLTWMVQAEFDGKKMTDDELRAFFVLLARGRQRHHPACLCPRHRTPSRSSPTSATLLVEDVPGRVGTAVEEVLRWASPLLHMRRTATQDITVRGSEIKAGDKVVLWYISGNRDEDVFDDPLHVRYSAKSQPAHRIRRRWPALLPRRGPGPHHAQVAADRGVHPHPDISAPEPHYALANFINGINSLPATWTPERS